MKQEWTFSVLPGDARHVFLGELLGEMGFKVAELSESALRRAVVIPLTGIMNDESVISRLGKGDVVFGPLSVRAAALCTERGVRNVDIAADEEFSITNAIPTVEGALMLTIERTLHTIHGARVLVMGVGRIGKLLVHHLKALGADTYAASVRADELAWAKALGAKTVELENIVSVLGEMQIVFNTIPAVVLDRPKLALLADEALVIDLASSPDGSALIGSVPGANVIKAGGLPGKTAPLSAARAMLVCILRELSPAQNA